MAYDRVGALQHQLLSGCGNTERWMTATLRELSAYAAEGDERAQELEQVLRIVHTWFPAPPVADQVGNLPN